MKASRLVPLLAVGLLGFVGCGTTRPGAPIARRETPAAARPAQAQAPAPANAPELDPANVERRFGVAENRARKQEAKRRQQDQQKNVDVVKPAPRKAP